MKFILVEYVHIQHHTKCKWNLWKDTSDIMAISQCGFCLMKTPNTKICMIYIKKQIGEREKWVIKNEQLYSLISFHMHEFTSNFRKVCSDKDIFLL
jgi:hypothetical protein